jgi:hypothetical protein
MIALDPTSRCIFIPFEVGSGGGLGRYDRVTGEFINDIEGNDAAEIPMPYTFPIQFRSSHTALIDVRFRESNTFLAAATRRPFRRLFHASLALMATNWSTLGSR